MCYHLVCFLTACIVVKSSLVHLHFTGNMTCHICHQSCHPLTFKPLYQNFNSHLLPLHISYTISGELLKYQANSPCVILPFILVTALFHKVLILQGEI